MSHEIRTPMNAILGFSELLTGLVHEPKAKSYLSAIHSSGHTLLQLINDILDLSKIEAGKLELEYESISVGAVLREIQQIFSQKAAQKDVQLRVEIDPALPGGLMLDEIRLRQMLFNSVGNALKFTEEGSVLMRALREPIPGPRRTLSGSCWRWRTPASASRKASRRASSRRSPSRPARARKNTAARAWA